MLLTLFQWRVRRMRVANENVPPRCTRHILWSSTLNYLGALHLLNLVVEEIYRRVPSGERERERRGRSSKYVHEAHLIDFLPDPATGNPSNPSDGTPAGKVFLLLRVLLLRTTS